MSTGNGNTAHLFDGIPGDLLGTSFTQASGSDDGNVVIIDLKKEYHVEEVRSVKTF